MRLTKLAATLAVALLIDLAVAGCGQTVAGAPEANPEAARLATGTTVDKAVAAMATFVKEARDFRSIAFSYATVNERKTGTELEVSVQGDPLTSVVKTKSRARPGADFDVYHPGGSPLDYVKLGPGHTGLAPTPWVSVPTYAPSGFVCAAKLLQTLCKINDAIVATEKAAPPGLAESATRLPGGGIEVRTGVTLKAFIQTNVINIPADVAALIEPEMLDRVVPAKVVLNQDGTLRQAEIRGEASGRKAKVQLEVGFETRGRPSSSDFPPTPQPAEVTAISDKAAVDEFWRKMTS